MGRWAQRKRRGGGPGGGATPEPPVTLLSITCDGTATEILTFSGPVVTPGGAADSALQISGEDVGPFGGQTGTTINVITGGGHIDGEPWALTAQPAWLTTPVVFPDSGTTIP